MAHHEQGIENLAHHMKDALSVDVQTEEFAVRAARVAFLDQAEQMTAPRGFFSALKWPRVGGLLAGGALAGMAATFWLQGQAALTYTSMDGEWGELGARLSASPSADLPVSFSDGTTLELQQNAVARVVSMSDEQARVVLESGQMDVVVNPDRRFWKRQRRTWRFESGAFEVIVTGTRFALLFNDRTGTLDVSLHEGSVTVWDACAKTKSPLKAGQHFTGTCTSVTPVATKALPVQVEPQPGIAPEIPSEEADAAGAEPRPNSSPETNWRTLHQEKKFKESFAAAEAAGFDGISRRADVNQLFELADVARYAGHVDRARAVLLVIRSRFSGTESAGRAAFRLGRLDFEQGGDFAGAARWFQTYLNEQPGSPLAGDALGRVLESHVRAGNHVAAQTAAKQYLKALPQGSQAELARRTLAK